MTDSITFAKAIADDTRQKLMQTLCAGWMCVNDIVASLNEQIPSGISQPTVSHHLSILREAGLVETERRGKQVFYTLNKEIVADCCGQIMQKFVVDQTER